MQQTKVFRSASLYTRLSSTVSSVVGYDISAADQTGPGYMIVGLGRNLEQQRLKTRAIAVQFFTGRLPLWRRRMRPGRIF